MTCNHPRTTGPMLSSPRCGARTRSGNACQSPAVRGKKRCRMHGGAAGSGGRPATAMPRSMGFIFAGLPYHLERERSREASSLGKHCNVARAVYDADDHDRIGMRQVIDGIGTVKRHPKARTKLLPRGTGKREMSKRLKGCLDLRRQSASRPAPTPRSPEWPRFRRGQPRPHRLGGGRAAG
jgi:hypothetical protein